MPISALAVGDGGAIGWLFPESYPRDAYSYAVNQSGHAYLVGVPAALALSSLGMAAALAVAAIYAVAWELGYQRWRWPQFFDWRDSLEDTVHVLTGAAVISAALAGEFIWAWECLAAQFVLLGVGVWRRQK